MRAGPGTDYPVVATIPADARVDIHGCISDGTWCDTSWNSERGWVSADYLNYLYNDNFVYLPEYIGTIDVPLVPFALNTYWNDYYAGEPWYGRLGYWQNFWRAHGRYGSIGRQDNRRFVREFGPANGERPGQRLGRGPGEQLGQGPGQRVGQGPGERVRQGHPGPNNRGVVGPGNRGAVAAGEHPPGAVHHDRGPGLGRNFGGPHPGVIGRGGPGGAPVGARVGAGPGGRVGSPNLGPARGAFGSVGNGPGGGGPHFSARPGGIGGGIGHGGGAPRGPAGGPHGGPGGGRHP
jgi:hypothetical protein